MLLSPTLNRIKPVARRGRIFPGGAGVQTAPLEKSVRNSGGIVLTPNRSRVEREEAETGALYTSIESLETEFRNGGYCPDLLDEKILIVREKIRLILAGPRQIGTDQNNVDGQAQEAQPGVEFVGLYALH